MNFDSRELRDLLDSIRFVYGYDFTQYAEASVKRRISHFVTNRKFEGLDAMGKAILRDEKLFEEFVRDMSVTVTEMFRDPPVYKRMRTNVMKRLATYPFIKIWIAGCATGEEVYSVAIMLSEENLLGRSVIYATDINQHSLQVAKEGVYDVEKMKEYTMNYQKAGGKRAFSEYYKAKYNSVMFDRELRTNIVFAPHNLATDKSFNEFQLIICRNVLIYFNQQLQNRVIGLFYESLCPFGFLGLGNKESLLFSDKRKFFEEVDHKGKIFMKAE
ncbi:MAG TPA: protein-glutamate O-methyltransferase CheR [Bacteroidia bacterium]|nr:protein-glutamate O-methyltransferase CheR [Bacteroidia bacterium]